MNSTYELGRHAARALKPYPAYKDSRIAWLGEVPEHWQVRRLKTLCSRSALYGANAAATSYTTAGVRFLRTTDITEDGQLNGRGVFLPQESVDNYLLADGDVLISRSGTIGRSFLYERRIHGPCAYAGYLVRFVPAPIALPKYIFLFTKTHAFAGFLRVKAISSTIENVNGEKYANCPLPLPPHSEQAAIVRFLDHADRRIRRYIRAKQQLIALLEEQKQATIHQAVTGQIDVRTGRPYAAYRDSGVEWLGSAPEHWERRRLKTLLRPVDHRSVDGNETLLSLRRDHGVVIYAEHFSRPSQGNSLVGFKVVVPGQLVVNRLQANNGLIFCSALGGLVSPDYSVFERRTAVQTRYLSDLLRTTAYRAHFRRWSTGLGTGTAGFLRIYDDDFLATPVALPSSAEQAAIVAYVDRVVADVATSTDRAERQVDLIREYHTRLIADVVTGKLDVREAAAGLPDEVKEPEPFDETSALIDGEEEPSDDLDAVPEEAEV